MKLEFLNRKNPAGQWIVKVKFPTGKIETIFVPEENYLDFIAAVDECAA